MPYGGYREPEVGLQLDNQELRSRLDESTAALLAEQRRAVDLKMRLSFAEDRLRGGGQKVAPVPVDGGRSAECGRCGLELEFEWDWCPCCGAGVDWRSADGGADDEEAYDRWRDGLDERGDAA